PRTEICLVLIQVLQIEIHSVAETSILADFGMGTKDYPSFSLTNVKIPVATLTTIKVAIARQTASLSVNFQMASMHRTVQATSERVMMTNEMITTRLGSITPLSSCLILTTCSFRSWFSIL